MNPLLVAVAAVIVALTMSGIAGLACYRWMSARRANRRLRTALADEQEQLATYRCWLDQPIPAPRQPGGGS